MSATLATTAPRVRSSKSPVDSEKLLWSQYHCQGHGGSSENEIVQNHLPLVKSIVGRVAMNLPAHVSVDDLYSSGLVGLLNAIRRYDSRSGTSFETYARVRIRGAIFDELRRLDWVPRSVHDKARKVEKLMHELEQTKGKAVTEIEMAGAMNLTLNDYHDLLQEIKPATFVCLDAVKNSENDDGADRYDYMPDEKSMPPDEGVERREIARMIFDRLQSLPVMQRKVLALYYYEDLRLREIAEVFGVTESRICQIHAQAIIAIKASLQNEELGRVACSMF